MLERLSKVDPLTFGDHYHLSAGDVCFYYGDYTARKNYSFSDTNQLISNLKKPVNRRGLGDYRYKGIAIEQVARAIIKHVRVGDVTFVPVPPSKAKSDPEYDGRMVQVLARAQALDPAVDFREMVVQSHSTVAGHIAESRPKPSDLEANYTVDMAACRAPVRGCIMVFDDVLTTGAHFVAMRNCIRKVYPQHEVYGLFVARRVPEADDFLDFEVL